MSDGDTSSGWNPAQREVITLLGKGDGVGRLTTEAAEALRAELLDELEGAVASLVDDLPGDDRVWVSKHALTSIHQCEAYAVGGQDQFQWHPANAQGTVAHKAIELMLNVRLEPYPAVLVDEAIARLSTSDQSLGDWLGSLGEMDLAELRSMAVANVSRFQECFPMPKPAWYPRTESRLGVELAGGRVRLSGKVDLTLGQPPDKVIIDLKSGWPAPHHREDLRFYALLELLSLGVPPRKVASYYLDQARVHPEDVTEGSLRSAARRAVDGMIRLLELRLGDREPARSPGTPCRWCTLAADCQPGKAYLASLTDDP